MAYLTRRQLATAAMVATLIPGSIRRAHAVELAAPKEKPILTVSGAIKTCNRPPDALFDREMLEGLGHTEIVTTTPWHTGPVKFEGVRLDALMTALGATGTTVKAYSLNDFTTNIPIEDFRAFGTILALKRNGEYMAFRDKGPLFIVYPFDAFPVLKQQMYYNRSAWQVARLVVE